ncbi:hypothetical protein N431DRAFT_514527 [Stipitochalara longipes BDJ]|nr:hypothetical protein N431DRAFT_514527 [Stipitochalara longipes BDJ]
MPKGPNVQIANIKMQSSLESAFLSANRGPLTKIWTPPASCVSETTLISYFTTISSLTTSYTTTKIFINHYSWGDGSCYPSTIATISGSTRWNNGYYYSPGICPSGWASACQAQTNAFGFPTTLASDTSAVICCPSNWDCVGGPTILSGHGCSTALSSGQTLTSVWPAPDPTPNVPMDIPSQKALTAWVVPSDTSALCDAIPVLWQNTDSQILSLLAELLTEVPASPTSSSTSGTGLNSGPTATGNSSNSSSGGTGSSLSSGAKAAIGVTIPLVFLALIAGIFFFFRRRNSKNKHLHQELPTSSPTDAASWTQLNDMKKQGLKGDASELDSSVVFEAGGGNHLAELGDERRSVVYEMEGTLVELGDGGAVKEKNRTEGIETTRQ